MPRPYRNARQGYPQAGSTLLLARARTSREAATLAAYCVGDHADEWRQDGHRQHRGAHGRSVLHGARVKLQHKQRQHRLHRIQAQERDKTEYPENCTRAVRAALVDWIAACHESMVVAAFAPPASKREGGVCKRRLRCLGRMSIMPIRARDGPLTALGASVWWLRRATSLNHLRRQLPGTGWFLNWYICV
jgi:hypothetical protein